MNTAKPQSPYTKSPSKATASTSGSPPVCTPTSAERLLEDLEAELTDAGFELRVRDDAGGWAW